MRSFPSDATGSVEGQFATGRRRLGSDQRPRGGSAALQPHPAAAAPPRGGPHKANRTLRAPQLEPGSLPATVPRRRTASAGPSPNAAAPPAKTRRAPCRWDPGRGRAPAPPGTPAAVSAWPLPCWRRRWRQRRRWLSSRGSSGRSARALPHCVGHGRSLTGAISSLAVTRAEGFLQKKRPPRKPRVGLNSSAWPFFRSCHETAACRVPMAALVSRLNDELSQNCPDPQKPCSLIKPRRPGPEAAAPTPLHTSAWSPANGFLPGTPPLVSPPPPGSRPANPGARKESESTEVFSLSWH